ncbi:NitT/TauT family transport system substrate-binding protein [Natronincola peptidivorans]|uniref:NitT/TauT family transport system substrate-binding protein n=1 Tax=Natronincola peptidivorans TaxID=426128 RepID=A0A1I0FLG1_9FIRM|nr:ABC transporter substrate-binding protein [Natronincola peptidivorans]SET58945.1 NitT/TauT family transport system substrate-binding protein [Natronincola peptidivorans]
MKRKGLLLLLPLLIAFSLVFLTGCGNSNEETAVDGNVEDSQTVESNELQKVVITEPIRSDLWAPIYLAQTLGFFAEEGIEADFQTITGGDPGAPVLAGEADFGLRGVDMPMMVTEAGQDVKILVSTTQRFPFTFIGQGPEFTTIESLKGQVVAGSTPSGSPTSWVKAAVANAGLDPEQDIEVPMVSAPGYVAAMSNGDIAACAGLTGYQTEMLLENGGVMLVDGRNPKAFKEIMGSEDYQMYIMFATDKYIEENPETVQSVVTAVAKAIQWQNESSTEEIVEALLPLFQDREEELLVSIQANKDYDIFSIDGKHTETGYQAALKLSKMAGVISKDIPAEKVYDESFLDNAWAKLGK